MGEAGGHPGEVIGSGDSQNSDNQSINKLTPDGARGKVLGNVIFDKTLDCFIPGQSCNHPKTGCREGN